jgi:hypothetical protein
LAPDAAISDAFADDQLLVGSTPLASTRASAELRVLDLHGFASSCRTSRSELGLLHARSASGTAGILVNGWTLGLLSVAEEPRG